MEQSCILLIKPGPFCVVVSGGEHVDVIIGAAVADGKVTHTGTVWKPYRYCINKKKSHRYRFENHTGTLLTKKIHTGTVLKTIPV
jgi:hypothetical protein